MIYFGKVTKNKIVIKIFNNYFKKRDQNIELVYKEMKTLLEKNNLLNTNCILAIKEEYKRKKNYELYIAVYSMYLSVIGLYSDKFNTQALDILVVIIPFMILILMWYIRIAYELITNKDRYYFNNMDDADAEEFIKFVENNWGTRISRYEGEDEEIQSKKRGRKPINN